MEVLEDYPPTAAASVPTCEAAIVKTGYIWLMVLLPTAGLVLAAVNLADHPSLAVLALAAVLVALGYWAWRRGYNFVQLALLPGALRIRPQAAGQPVEDIPLARIANYLRPQETYYQVLELQLHSGASLRFSKRLRSPAGLLTLDAWAEQLAQRLEQTRPVAVPGEVNGAAVAPGSAGGLLATPPRVFARTTFGKVLAGLAGAWLLLALLTLLGPGHVPSAVFVVPSLYLGYYFRARGVLKIETKVLTGIEADRDNWKHND